MADALPAALARYWAAVAAVNAGTLEIDAARVAALAEGAYWYMLEQPSPPSPQPPAVVAPVEEDMAGAVQLLSDAADGLADTAAHLAGRRSPPCAAPQPERGRRCRRVGAATCMHGFCAACCKTHHTACENVRPPAGKSPRVDTAHVARPGKRAPAPLARAKRMSKAPPRGVAAPPPADVEAGASSSEEQSSSE